MISYSASLQSNNKRCKLTAEELKGYTKEDMIAYFSLMYDLLKGILCKQHVVQADETTCNVVRDDRPAGTNRKPSKAKICYHGFKETFYLEEKPEKRSGNKTEKFFKKFSLFITIFSLLEGEGRFRVIAQTDFSISVQVQPVVQRFALYPKE